MTTITVLVADGQRLFAQSVAVALGRRSDMKVIPKHPWFGLRAAEAAIEGKPDVAVIDHWMAGMKGPAVAAMLRHRLPRCKVLLTSAFTEEREMQSGFDAGAAGFVSKTCTLSELEDAILLAELDDRAIYSGEITSRRPSKPGARVGGTPDPKAWSVIGSLSPREVEVLELLPLGTARAAELLSVTPKTLRNHVYNACKKLRARSQTEALSLARRFGVIHEFPLVTDVTRNILHKGERDRLPDPADLHLPSRNGKDATPTGAISVVVADALRLFSQALAVALRTIEGFDVQPETPATDHATIDLVERSKPNVAIIDFWMPHGGGERLIREILQRHPDCKVIVSSWVHAPMHVASAIEAGAAAFIPKGLTLGQLAEVIRKAQAGETLVYGKQLAEMAHRLEDSVHRSELLLQRFSRVTPQEKLVLRMLAKGYDVAEVARRLGVRPNTVNAHVVKLLSKTQTHSQVEVVSLARMCGMFVD